MSDDSGMTPPAQEVRRLVADVLGLDVAMVSEATGPATESAWDSLAHLSIVTAVEQKHRVQFTMNEIRSIENVRDLARLLEARLTA